MKSSALKTMFNHCYERAQRSGKDRRCPLRGGAAFAVRVRAGVVTAAISRPDKPLGDTEIITFHTQFGVPEHAERIPETGQGRHENKHYVAWRWPVETD